MDISNSIENGQSTIVRPSNSFNFESSAIHYFKHCNAHFTGSNFPHHRVDVSNCIENAQSTIVIPSWRFNFQSSGIHLFKQL